MFDLIPDLLTLILSILFPVYASYKALQTSDIALLTPWLTYFVVVALVNSALSTLSFILGWVPFYSWLRLGLHLYLLLPGEHQGATYVYRTHIRPVLVEHDAQIEQFIATAHDRARTMGLEYWEQIMNYIKQSLLGEKSGRQSAQTQPTSHGPSTTNPNQSYTQALLSRFSQPAAVPPSTDAPRAPTHDATSFLNSALDVIVTAGLITSDAKAGQTPLPHLAVPPALSDPAERLGYINAQAERLRALLGIFDKQAKALRESQELDLAAEPRHSDHVEQMPGTLVDSTLLDIASSLTGDLKSSRSESDFERIEHDDAKSMLKHEDSRMQESVPVLKVDKKVEASGGWGTWMFGRKRSAANVPVVAVVEEVSASF